MNLRHLTARTAVAGVTAALAAGALVGISTPAANAATGGSGAYNCTTPLSPNPIPLTVAISADLAGLPALPSGFAADAGTLHFGFTYTIKKEVTAGLKAAPLNVKNLGTADVKFALPFGDATIPVEGLNLAKAPVPDNADFVLPVPAPGASQGAFRLPSPGTDIPVKLPTTFTMTAVTDSTLPPAQAIALTCTIVGDAPTLATLTVVKQGSTIGKIKAPKSVKAKKKFSIVANVAGSNVPATGKVVAKEGKKVLGKGTLKNGKAKIVVKKGIKKVGKHTITISYAGDTKTSAALNPSTVSVKVKAAKKK